MDMFDSGSYATGGSSMFGTGGSETAGSAYLPANSNAPAGGPPPAGPPVPPANTNKVSPAMIAATLGMGDYLEEGGGGAGAGGGATATASASEASGGIPREVLDRVGYVFDHDGGYAYKITSEGYFEIVKAPEDRGLGYDLTPTGEFASAWQTLADYIVAMGPANGAPKQGPEAQPTQGWGPYPGPGTGPGQGPRQGQGHGPPPGQGHGPRQGQGHGPGHEPGQRPPAEGEPTTDNRPARPSSPGAQMSSLLSTAKANAAGMTGICYKQMKINMKACGGYGDILDIYHDERFAGFGDSAYQFADAVRANGAAALGLREIGGMPKDAPPGTILVLKGNGKANISEKDGDISVISGVSGGCIICYNDGEMKLIADPNVWESGEYAGILRGMFQPIARR